MTRKIFKQGDVYLVEFKPERVGSYGKRPVVCLHDCGNHCIQPRAGCSTYRVVQPIRGDEESKRSYGYCDI